MTLNGSACLRAFHVARIVTAWSILASTQGSAVADERILVTSRQYPAYEDSPNADFPKVPVIFDCRWPEGTSHDFFVMDEDQILPAGRYVWTCHDPDLGFCVGSNCMCVCDDGTKLYGSSAIGHPRRRWYLWFRWYGKSAHQALIYRYSDKASKYSPPAGAGVGTDEAFFEPVTDSTYLEFWKKHQAFLSTRIKLSLPVTDWTEPIAIIWKQYVKICPKTFTDSLRDGFGWEGPGISPEPNDGVLVPAIDLRAGMRLRVDYAAYTDAESYSGGTNPDANQLFRGYVGSGTSYFSVTRMPRGYDEKLGPFGSSGRGSNPVLVLDSFFGHMNQAMAVPGLFTEMSAEGRPNVPNVVTSPLDISLKPPYAMRQHLRLVYPMDGETSEESRLLGTRNNGQSQLYLEVKNHPALISADERTGLSAAQLKSFVVGVPAMTQGQRFSANVDPDPFGFNRRLFVVRGRSLPIPEIAIRLNGVETFVPCGTRLRQLAERHLEGPPAALARQIQLYRRVEGRPVPVCFHCDDEGMVLEIPLMKGDVVSW